MRAGRLSAAALVPVVVIVLSHALFSAPHISAAGEAKCGGLSKCAHSAGLSCDQCPRNGCFCSAACKQAMVKRCEQKKCLKKKKKCVDCCDEKEALQRKECVRIGGDGMDKSGAACPKGKFQCSGGCKDLATDNNNCGQCSSACQAGFRCNGGRCTGTLREFERNPELDPARDEGTKPERNPGEGPSRDEEEQPRKTTRPPTAAQQQKEIDPAQRDNPTPGMKGQEGGGEFRRRLMMSIVPKFKKVCVSWAKPKGCITSAATCSTPRPVASPTPKPSAATASPTTTPSTDPPTAAPSAPISPTAAPSAPIPPTAAPSAASSTAGPSVQPEQSCVDGVRSGVETDVDCGGGSGGCLPCGAGLSCGRGEDCASGACGHGAGGEAGTCLDRSLLSASAFRVRGARTRARAGELLTACGELQLSASDVRPCQSDGAGGFAGCNIGEVCVLCEGSSAGGAGFCAALLDGGENLNEAKPPHKKPARPSSTLDVGGAAEVAGSTMLSATAALVAVEVVSGGAAGGAAGVSASELLGFAQHLGLVAQMHLPSASASYENFVSSYYWINLNWGLISDEIAPSVPSTDLNLIEGIELYCERLNINPAVFLLDVVCAFLLVVVCAVVGVVALRSLGSTIAAWKEERKAARLAQESSEWGGGAQTLRQKLGAAVARVKERVFLRRLFWRLVFYSIYPLSVACFFQLYFHFHAKDRGIQDSDVFLWACSSLAFAGLGLLAFFIWWAGRRTYYASRANTEDPEDIAFFLHKHWRYESRMFWVLKAAALMVKGLFIAAVMSPLPVQPSVLLVVELLYFVLLCKHQPYKGGRTTNLMAIAVAALYPMNSTLLVLLGLGAEVTSDEKLRTRMSDWQQILNLSCLLGLGIFLFSRRGQSLYDSFKKRKHLSARMATTGLPMSGKKGAIGLSEKRHDEALALTNCKL